MWRYPAERAQPPPTAQSARLLARGSATARDLACRARDGPARSRGLALPASFKSGTARLLRRVDESVVPAHPVGQQEAAGLLDQRRLIRARVAHVGVAPIRACGRAAV